MPTYAKNQTSTMASLQLMLAGTTSQVALEPKNAVVASYEFYSMSLRHFVRHDKTVDYRLASTNKRIAILKLQSCNAGRETGHNAGHLPRPQMLARRSGSTPFRNAVVLGQAPRRIGSRADIE